MSLQSEWGELKEKLTSVEGPTTQQQFETLLNLMNYNVRLTHQMENVIMALRAEVQALVDADTAMDAAITAALAQLTTLNASVASLQAQVTALQNQSAVIDPADLAGIVSVTNDITSQVSALKAALPAPPAMKKA